VYASRQARKRLLDLAAKATALAEYFERSANWYKVEQEGLGKIESPSDLHRREAAFLTKLAGRELRPTVFVSNKKRGREPRLFIQRLSYWQKTWFGVPCEGVIAAITNLAYPTAGITVEHVHNARTKMPQLHSEPEEGDELHFPPK
jgi:hypothetical protein